MNKSIKKHGRDISFLHSKKATLINFTGSSYHWGCFGTSMEIYHSLLEKNYYIETVDVSTTHRLSPTVKKISDFDDNNFFKLYVEQNPRLMTTLTQSDVIVVNGEGTLHRMSKGSVNLLYIIYACKKYLDKEVHVINFSCFPNGDNSMPEGISNIYPNTLRHADRIIPRDHVSNDILSNSGVETTQGFDCLPRFLNRHQLANTHKPKDYILVSGGVTFGTSRYEMLTNILSYFLSKNVSVKFLSGAHFSPASEDVKLQSRLRSQPNLSGLEVVEAKSMLQWVKAIQNASFLFSARFHHSMAALTLGTPFSYMNSNTPKITSVIETLNEDVANYLIGEDDHETVKHRAKLSLEHGDSNKSTERLNKMVTLAQTNFEAL